MRKLRILAISHMFPTTNSRQYGVYICREALYLAKYGIECHFLVGRPWAPWPLHYIPRWRDYGPANHLVPPDGSQARLVPYLRPPGFGFRRFEGKSMARSMLPAARNWHRREPFDVVLGVSMLPDAEAAVAVGEDLGLPVASLAVGSDVMVYPNRMPVLWRRLCETLERVDLPVGVSRSVCTRLAQTGKCRREPLCVYLSRDTKQFAPAGCAAERERIREELGVPKRGIVAIYTGGMVEAKGMNELTLAAEPLLRHKKDFVLACVGDGPARDRLVGLRDRIGRRGTLVLPGRIVPEEVPRWLQASDFLVLPSHHEGMPQAVLEAMNCGLPVVATRVGGTPEAVIDGETGLLIEPKDVGGLQAAIERMIDDDAFRLSASAKGLARARDVFDPESNARTFAGALCSLMEPSSSVARS